MKEIRNVCVFRFCDVTAAERLRSGWTRGGIHTNRASGYAGRDTDRYTHTHTHARIPCYTYTHTLQPLYILFTDFGHARATHTHIQTATHCHTPSLKQNKKTGLVCQQQLREMLPRSLAVVRKAVWKTCSENHL